LRNEVIDQALETTISRARLSKYLTASEGNLRVALDLYERNTTLSERSTHPFKAWRSRFETRYTARCPPVTGGTG
jgi:hypothetical protein